MMDDFVSESESDYTSYWRDWVSSLAPLVYFRSKGRVFSVLPAAIALQKNIYPLRYPLQFVCAQDRVIPFAPYIP